jgi:hypothetical protein
MPNGRRCDELSIGVILRSALSTVSLSRFFVPYLSAASLGTEVLMSMNFTGKMTDVILRDGGGSDDRIKALFLAFVPFDGRS